MGYAETEPVWKIRDLTPNQKLVLLDLVRRSNREKGFVTWPSMATIATDTGIKDRKTVRRQVRVLEERGFITAEERFTESDDGETRQTSHLYVIHLEAIAAAAASGNEDEQGGGMVPQGVGAWRPEGGGMVPQQKKEENREEEQVTHSPAPDGADERAAGHTGHLGEPDTVTAEPEPADPFDEWWQHYPRKKDKGHARRAYAAALKKTDANTLLAAVIAFERSSLGRDPQFLPYGATWLNGERWADVDDKRTQSPRIQAAPAALAPDDAGFVPLMDLYSSNDRRAHSDPEPPQAGRRTRTAYHHTAVADPGDATTRQEHVS